MKESDAGAYSGQAQRAHTESIGSFEFRIVDSGATVVDAVVGAVVDATLVDGVTAGAEAVVTALVGADFVAVGWVAAAADEDEEEEEEEEGFTYIQTTVRRRT
jgi:hypothetical protein